MLPQEIQLVDSKESLCSAWENAFDGIEGVNVRCGDFFEKPTDAMVSPANSFGFMDGGLDDAISQTLKGSIQGTVQEMILEKFHGEIPVGSAEIVETEDDRWPRLVVAPTMRVPENVGQSVSAYTTFRAILLSVVNFNKINATPIKSLLVPGLATGVGRMPFERCALQMRCAYDAIFHPARIPSFQTIHTTHLKMVTA